VKLSIIVIAYNMRREIPRTLQSLAKSYQRNCADLDYEVLLVDNGSTPPLSEDLRSPDDTPTRLLRIDNAHPSPARAINTAVRAASGELLCLMIDGAHLLTPGVLHMAQAGMTAFGNAVIATRYFFLGPDEQNRSISNGYDKVREDQLLQGIDWPHQGYRLFEIGTPLSAGAKKVTWLNRMFESNCLFLKRSLFDAIGGADEKFDYPGGGFLNLDLHKRAADATGVSTVQLIGEGSFHQLHGGTTTNTTMAARQAMTAKYRQQYLRIRGHDELMPERDVFYLGHLPTQASKIHLKNVGP
jgi:glycosyltransferase involved in cell wall biosynthesis